MKIVISSGHGKYIRGAEGLIDEVNEARRVVHHVVDELSNLDVEAIEYHDNISDDQSENLTRIVDYHNAQGPHDLDVSVHFNAYEPTEKPMGTECLYVSDAELAESVARAMANSAGFFNRGAKFRDDLYFLNQTLEKAILLEVCFVDSTADVELYDTNFDRLCEGIAAVLAGQSLPEPVVEVRFEGTCSWFGGPEDDGVAPDEGLAFIYEVDAAPHLFLPQQPPGTTGLARRLNPEVYYVACRWDYDVTPKTMLDDPDKRALVINKMSRRAALAWPADWGPHEEKTGRAADLSPGLMEHLGLTTDDEVEVIYPAPTEFNS
jgi:N-acetylmuramoyl-L-alanine amidase